MEQIKLPNHPEPFWRHSTTFKKYPTLQKNIKADVCIVGAGMTGVTAAYLLAKQGVSVALIEASQVLNGTTGHTTAKITSQHGLIYDELIQHFGLENAQLYHQANEEGAKLIENLIHELKIDCDYEKQDAFLFTNDDDYVEKLANEQKAYEKIGIDGALQESMPLQIPIKSSLIMRNQAQFHPLKYLKVLLKACEQLGVAIYEGTTGMDVEFNKHPAVITNDGHRVQCKYVISASHFPFFDGQGFYFARMYAERAYAITFNAHEKYPQGMYINTEQPTRSIRKVTINGEDRWLVGGETHKTGQGKPTKQYYVALKKYAETHFSVKDYLYRWSTQDLTTLDKVPYIGQLTKGHQNIFVATGFRKWGMTHSTIAAKIISDQIIGKENPYVALYTPSRFKPDPSLKNITTMNADVAKHLVKGKIEQTKYNVEIEDLKRDQATVKRIKSKRVGVYKDQDDKLHVVDTTCTHMGCEVEWNSGERTWDCPCHGSRFSFKGEVIEGPAKRPLEKIAIKYQDNMRDHKQS